jgi:hypothetical protein
MKALRSQPDDQMHRNSRAATVTTLPQLGAFATSQIRANLEGAELASQTGKLSQAVDQTLLKPELTEDLSEVGQESLLAFLARRLTIDRIELQSVAHPSQRQRGVNIELPPAFEGKAHAFLN